MGLFESLFPKKAQEKEVDGYFKTFNAYTPTFTSYDGGLYEMDLTRSAIHTIAQQCSKLKPEVTGEAMKRLEHKLQYRPNDFMDTSKFLYRLATILMVNNTAFIIPLYGNDYKTIVGYYPLLPSRVEVVEYHKKPWLRYTFINGQKSAIELSKVGILTRYQYRDDFFGESNEAMQSTLEVLDMQDQGMKNAIEQGASIRFMAKLGQTLRPDDIDKERNRFSRSNLSRDNASGVMMFDAKYSEVKQVDSKPYVIDDKQMGVIKNNVFNYFGVNEDILQNKFNEDTWNAFYEGQIEPFATQLGLVMTNMTFTDREIAHGNSFMFSANRMQYASNSTKLQVSTQLFDRGILSANQVNEIWNLPPVEDGDKHYIRKEYTEISELNSEGGDAVANTEESRVSDDDGSQADNGTDRKEV